MRVGKFTTMTLAAVMVVVAAGRTASQQLSIRRYGVSNGLAHSGVRCIRQDAKGYIWFGTQEGLSRFDGYRFTNYGTRDGLILPYINDIAEDRRGRLWVGTNGGGVARFLDDPRDDHRLSAGSTADNSKFVNFSIGDSIASNYVDRILFDAEGTLWCVTDAGQDRGTLGANSEPKFEAVAARVMFGNAAAFADSQGRLWFGLEEDLIEVVQDRIIKYGLADEFGRHPITGITEDRQGRVFVSADVELFEFITPVDNSVRGKWKRLPLTLGPGQRIGRSTADVDGTLWIATNRG